MLSKAWPRGAYLWAMALAGPCQADLPLTVEDLLAGQDELRLETELTYTNEAG